MRNPWETGAVVGNGVHVMYCDVLSRLNCVKTATPERLRAMIVWPDTQKTVRQAVERRLRKLNDQPYGYEIEYEVRTGMLAVKIETFHRAGTEAQPIKLSRW